MTPEERALQRMILKKQFMIILFTLAGVFQMYFLLVFVLESSLVAIIHGISVLIFASWCSSAVLERNQLLVEYLNRGK